MDLERLVTEGRNPDSTDIDRLSARQIVQLMNREDARVAEAIGREAGPIAEAVELIAGRLRAGGRLVYIGAGTSGRLGVLDASECPPTFNSPPGQVVGLIAGGAAASPAPSKAPRIERKMAAHRRGIGLSVADVLVGIATSGRTPYVIGGLKYARSVGAATVGLSCNPQSALHEHADIAITPVVGPEVVSGSTRLKAGTATKMVLNMLTTGAMIRLGKTYGNLMVDLQARNAKLADRSARIVSAVTGCPREDAVETLRECGGEVKTAIVARRRGVNADEARQLLRDADGHLSRVLDGGEP